ncbi:Caspase Dronc [Eumeta japonica]|uniref:Caspase Dronc n=1 Tax=Eumeta variegata TaxID=151549 RepID=A0A4C1SA41_EUMVA|nr:Caspase Dronc [Eumeta japonica]
MDANQRNRILQNVDTLINLTEFNKLCQACFDYRLLTPVMIQNIYQIEPDKLLAEPFDDYSLNRERHKRLFVKITKRGPDAFEKLRRIFNDLKYKEASKILFGVDERMISISSSKEKGEPTSGNDDIVNGNIAANNLDDRDGIE